MQLHIWLDEIAQKMQGDSFSKWSIQRLTTELAAHYHDLMEENSMSSMTHEEVIQRLGTSDSIVAAAQRQRRDSYPWLYFIALPFLGTFASFVATTAAFILVMALASYLGELLFARMGWSFSALEKNPVVQILVPMLWCSIPVLSALLVSTLASKVLSRRDNKAAWVVIAFVIIACLAAPMQNSMSWDSRNMSTGMNFSLNIIWLINGLRIAQITIPMIVLAMLLRQRSQATPSKESKCVTI